MDIPFGIKSRFLAACEQAIRTGRDALDGGETVRIALEEGGYSGRVLVEIRSGDTNSFGSDWNGGDLTRFPARIKAAATALLHCGCIGRFLIVHAEGLLEIRQA